MLAMLACAGCASGGRIAHWANRPALLAAESKTARRSNLAADEEIRIVFDPSPVVQPEAANQPAAVQEQTGSEAALIDLCGSPFRDIGREAVAGGCRSELRHCPCGGRLGLHCRAAWITCLGCTQECLAETCLDCQDFYSLRGLAISAVPLGTAAILANTSLDEDFRVWHEDHVRTSASDELAGVVRGFGDGRIMVPVFAGAALMECLAGDERPVLQTIGNWGNRCSRSVLVGGPAVLGLAYLLGSSRPTDDLGSEWRLLDDHHSVSGHAFIGATVFLNAANMTENTPAKVAFYGLSALSAWSRVNQDCHYLSQVVLGWGIAWLAADVVNRTERGQRNWVVVPYTDQDSVGLQSIVTF